MSERTKVLGEALRRVGNPFVVCELVSQRARQLISLSPLWPEREAIAQALRELAAACLDFQMLLVHAQEPADVSEARKPAGNVEQAQAAWNAKEASVEASTR